MIREREGIFFSSYRYSSCSLGIPTMSKALWGILWLVLTSPRLSYYYSRHRTEPPSSQKAKVQWCHAVALTYKSLKPLRSTNQSTK